MCGWSAGRACNGSRSPAQLPCQVTWLWWCWERVESGMWPAWECSAAAGGGR